jgi:DNA modification methylase
MQTLVNQNNIIVSNTLQNRSIAEYLVNFVFEEKDDLFATDNKTTLDFHQAQNRKIPIYINEFWTSKQRQSSSIHEISYRACFKAQLPRFFIQLFTNHGDIVYDPFTGRGTTIIEAALLARNVIGNDVNPLSKLLTLPRLSVPSIKDVELRLSLIPIKKSLSNKIDLSMFYHRNTLQEILSIRQYLFTRSRKKQEDNVDSWIRMVATNRLTGHSSGFFSVYSLPPNQAISAEKQRKINKQRKQKPEYRNTKELILRKTKSLISDVSRKQIQNLSHASDKAMFLNKDARETSEIPSETVQLIVTSPPFLDVVQYAEDNWLRCWFNHIDAKKVEKNITMSKRINDWSSVMQTVFKELFRITKPNGFVAFEVGEVRGGKIKLEEYVVPLGITAGFECLGIMINLQEFTKTANIWGVSNNKKGTNTNRIVLFRKP